MKKVLPILLSILLFTLGLGVMFYPTVSNWIHGQTASYAVSNYHDQISNKSNEDYEAEFVAARAYNATLSGNVSSFLEAQLHAEADYENPDYWNTLDEINGIMGVIEIPTIDVTLPIYHGSEEEVLQKGVGHLEGSALPTGDVGIHTVLTGHTGLPTATLFTDLDELMLGDLFYLDILNEIYTYQVINIFVVLPSETEQLVAQADKNLVTLVTCTPYGVNSHRLLIQGERVETQPAEISTTAQEELLPQVEPSPLDNLSTLIPTAMALGGVLLISIVVFAVGGRRRPLPKVDQPPPAPSPDQSPHPQNNTDHNRPT